MWTCPKCGTKVDPSFEVCWHCGTTPDGVEDPTFVPADAASPAESPLDLDMPVGDDPLPEPANPVAGELVECYFASNQVQAKFLADQLSEQGIPAFADTTDALGDMGAIGPGPRVWVRAEDLTRAKAWLEEYDRQFKEEHGELERG
jgi:hypothetical protein